MVNELKKGMNKMDLKEWYLKQIRETWFPTHKASININYSSDITIIDFKRADNSFQYAVRIILDRNYIFIGGDIGEAVYCLTEQAEIKKIANYDIYYFTGKLKCCDGEKEDFETKVAVDDLKYWFDEMKDCYYCDNEKLKKLKKVYKILIGLATDVGTIEEWKMKLYGDYYNTISEVDELHESQLWEVGRATPIRMYAYLEIFKIINKMNKCNKCKELFQNEPVKNLEKVFCSEECREEFIKNEAELPF